MLSLYFLLSSSIQFCHSGYYVDNKVDKFNGVVKHSEVKESTLACLQTCTFLNLAAVYEGTQCYCVEVSEYGDGGLVPFSLPVRQFKKLKLKTDPPPACNKLSCHDGVQNVGCFREDVEPLASMIMLSNNRSMINWEPSKFKQFVHSFIIYCASKARKGNFKFFSIRYYGECFAGTDVSELETMKYNVTTHSDDCDLGDGSYGKCNGKSDGTDQECVGKASSDYVYLIKELASEAVV